MLQPLPPAHEIHISKIDDTIDAADLPVGMFGQIVDHPLYTGHIVLRIWRGVWDDFMVVPPVHLLSLSDPKLTWYFVTSGAFRVVPLPPGTKLSIVIGDTKQ